MLTSAAKGDAPNFDMPDEIDDRSDDAVTEFSLGGQRMSTDRLTALDDQQQACRAHCFPKVEAARRGKFEQSGYRSAARLHHDDCTSNGASVA